MSSNELDAIAELADKHRRTWPNLTQCAKDAAAERAKIAGEVAKLVPADCSFLVFGSLARDEFTGGSDVDWALLVDGPASPQRLDVAKGVAQLLKTSHRGRPRCLVARCSATISCI